jgi:UDP-N-acetylglucosamine 4,6-dehydratase
MSSDAAIPRDTYDACPSEAHKTRSDKTIDTYLPAVESYKALINIPKPTNKNILIFGGSGSLGLTLVHELKESGNKITNFSRDELKQWKMTQDYPGVDQILGDVRNAAGVLAALRNVEPDVVIFASALKHIDRCEYQTTESVLTNVTGTQNVMNACSDPTLAKPPEVVVFISTDKAAHPTNVYGMCKALSERVTIEHAMRSKRKTRFVCVRYGNVVNSRGSIIPMLLHHCEKDGPLRLTHREMTRFLLTLEEAVSLICYAILKLPNGCIAVPRTRSMRIEHLFDLFCGAYNKTYNVVGIRPGEKLDEKLVTQEESVRVQVAEECIMVVHPAYEKLTFAAGEPYEYHSGMNVMTMDEVGDFLRAHNYLPALGDKPASVAAAEAKK